MDIILILILNTNISLLLIPLLIQMATLVAIFLIVYSLLRPLIAEPTPVIIRSK